MEALGTAREGLFRNAMTWISEDAPASTGTPAPAAPRQNR